MFSRIAVLALTCAMAHANVINHANGDIKLNTAAGRKLVQNARRVAQNNNAYYYGNVNGQSQYDGDYSEIDWDNIDTSYLAGYSVKFQGCHHVQQWNDNAAEEDIKIMTQRLVRFRMCPADSCSSSSTKGCDKNYGDYLVDMETYVNVYLTQIGRAHV